jgi:hypothetical protein
LLEFSHHSLAGRRAQIKRTGDSGDVGGRSDVQQEDGYLGTMECSGGFDLLGYGPMVRSSGKVDRREGATRAHRMAKRVAGGSALGRTHDVPSGPTDDA